MMLEFIYPPPPSISCDQPYFDINVTATDPVTSLSAKRSYRVSLSHANRPPSWMVPIPWMVTPALTSGLVGLPLLQYVSDDDFALNIGENASFAITAGNMDSTFAIQVATGQLFVLNNATAAFQYPGSVTTPPTFNLTIRVTDAGINGPRYSAQTNVTVQVGRACLCIFLLRCLLDSYYSHARIPTSL